MSKKQQPKKKAIMVSEETHQALWGLCKKGDTLDIAIYRLIETVQGYDPIAMYPDESAICEYCKLANIAPGDLFSMLEERDCHVTQIKKQTDDLNQLHWVLANMKDKIDEIVDWSSENKDQELKLICEEIDTLLEETKE